MPPHTYDRTWTRKDGTSVTKTYHYPDDYQRITPEQRFFPRVDKDAEGGCWLWTGGQTLGYGRFWNGHQHDLAHRYSWEYHRGEIPEGVQVRHRCAQRLCVNPDHLFLGSAWDHVRDRMSEGHHC